MEINDILLEWSYRLKKGYPTMEDGKFTEPRELEVLHEILKENGINEMPSFVKSKTPVSDVVGEAEEEEKKETASVEMTKEQLIQTIEEADDLDQTDLLKIFRMVDSKKSQGGLIGALEEVKLFDKTSAQLTFREAADTDSYKQLESLLADQNKLINIDALEEEGGNLFTEVKKLKVSDDFAQWMANLVPYTSVKMGRFEMFLRLFLKDGRSPKSGEAADVMVGKLKLEVKATKKDSGFRLRGQEKIGHGNDVAQTMLAGINQLYGGEADEKVAVDPKQTSIPEPILKLADLKKQNIYYKNPKESWAYQAFEDLLKNKKATLTQIQDMWVDGLSKVYRAAEKSHIQKYVLPAIGSDGIPTADFNSRLAAFEFLIYSGALAGELHFDRFMAIGSIGQYFLIDPKMEFEKILKIFQTKFKVKSPTTSYKSQAQDLLTSNELREELVVELA
tara:strand:- start:1776 stop:3119 length:1344 start_codon:yes stop_codon:yes gene_type:complete